MDILHINVLDFFPFTDINSPLLPQFPVCHLERQATADFCLGFIPATCVQGQFVRFI